MPLSSYLLSLPVVADVDLVLNFKDRLLGWLPFNNVNSVFFVLIPVPNRHVPKYHVLASGVICNVLFEFAKYGFGIHIREMSDYQNIYGAVTVFPLFLI